MKVIVIGGGVAGLTAAYHLRRQAAERALPLHCRVVETDHRAGGKVLTQQHDGMTLEGGPDVVVGHKPAARELASELGLDERVIAVAPGDAAILWRGAWVAVPRGSYHLAPVPREVLTSPLFSWRGKLRILAEPLMPARRGGGDESLASLVRRRLGQEALDRLAEPLLGHVHAALPESLSVAAAFPHLARAETQHGSLRRAARARGGPPGVARPAFWTLRDGMGELVSALTRQLGEASLLLRSTVAELRPRPSAGYQVRLADGRELEADAVVVATPAAAAARLLPELRAWLAALTQAPLAILSLAWPRQHVHHPPRGLGFFVPRIGRPDSERLVLAGTWTSNKLPTRAPAEIFLARLFLGEDGGRALSRADDEELVSMARAFVEPLLGVTGAPVLARLVRWPDGYPQYDVGHVERVAALESRLPDDLVLAGAAYHGVGLPDCIASGRRAAEKLLGLLHRRHLLAAASGIEPRLTGAAAPC